MRVLLFVSSDPGRPGLVDPMLVIAERPDAVLPPHPQGLEWRYFATTTLDDQLLAQVKFMAEAALADYGWFVFGEPLNERSTISHLIDDEATLRAFRRERAKAETAGNAGMPQVLPRTSESADS
jgi:hypothetical protein